MQSFLASMSSFPCVVDSQQPPTSLSVIELLLLIGRRWYRNSYDRRTLVSLTPTITYTLKIDFEGEQWLFLRDFFYADLSGSYNVGQLYINFIRPSSDQYKNMGSTSFPEVNNREGPLMKFLTSVAYKRSEQQYTCVAYSSASGLRSSRLSWKEASFFSVHLATLELADMGTMCRQDILQPHYSRALRQCSLASLLNRVAAWIAVLVII